MQHGRPRKTFFARLGAMFLDSFDGARYVFSSSQTLKTYLPIFAAFFVIVGIVVGFRPIEWVIFALLARHIISSESLNSSIEETNDAVTTNYDERIKRSKDIASWSVFIHNITGILVLIFFTICRIIDFPWWEYLL
ncbi:diacylglycerol kinase [Candidatus Saccharibacteria bacterium]|nr:diacylglycerol kinase [Candidatus Saccharibacteria bacterium]